MRFLWHSATPLCNSGYGKIGREIILRLKAAGHEVSVGTKHPHFGTYEWGDVSIFPGLDIGYMNEYIKEYSIDYVITLWDIWLLAGKRTFPKEKWIAYVPTDTNEMSSKLKEVAARAGRQLAMSKAGFLSMERAGFKPIYTPHGVDMKTLRPDDAARKAFRESFGWGDDIFVIGSVGLNYRDDRKGFIPLMQAFKKFHEARPDSRLYLHTDAGLKGGDTIPFAEIAQSLGIGEWVAWPNQMSYVLNLIDENWLRSVYNGMDVFCLPTRGEGFGIPAVDAQACGVPVILSNNTTGPELCKTGWLIDTDDDDLRWMTNDAWRNEPQSSAVLCRLEQAHDFWRSDPVGWRTNKALARERILEYDWDAVWTAYWEPFFKSLNQEKRSI